MDDNCKVFKGKYYLPWKTQPLETKHFKTPEKVVVFDLDETLGSFGDLYILWSGIRHLVQDFDFFEDLANMFPETIRFGILTILEYLYRKKQKNQCKKIYIYTNNQCSGDWVKRLTDFLCLRVRQSYQHHQNLNRLPTEPLFDQLICAFRINNKPIELLRTSHKKSINDLIDCTLLSKDADVCFIDDVEHRQMKNSQVYYICPRPYYHNLTAEDIVTRLINSPLLNYYRLKKPMMFSQKFWIPWFSNYKRSYFRQRCLTNNFHEDLLVSKKLMYHLKEFMAWKRPPKPYNPTKKSKSQKERVLPKKRRSMKNTKNKRVVNDSS